MELQNNLKLVEEDLTSFIEAQKKSLVKEKVDLLSKSHKQSQSTDIKKTTNMRISEQSADFGLNLGGYEDKQKKLRDERQREYKQYLEDQLTRRITNRAVTETEPQSNRNQVAQRQKEQKDYKTNIDREYENILQKKKNEETLYRVQFNEDGNGPQSNGISKKTIEFDSSDDELYQYVMKKKMTKRQKSADHVNRSLKANVEAPVDDGRSSSVPPRPVPYIFGGSSHAMMKKMRNLENRKALEEQIKEKEAIKYKEKLKRMGRITSDMDLDQTERAVSKAKRPSTKILEQASQYSDQNVAQGFSNMNGSNPSSVYPNQNNVAMQPPIYNPMVGYQPPTWPVYGGMMPNGFMQNNMGYQLMPPQQQQTNYNDRRYIGDNNVGQQKAQVPPLQLDDSPPDAYVPSALQQNSIPKHTGRGTGVMTNVMIGESPRDANASNKRAQQAAYKIELEKQMQVKKAASEKDKLERMKYEMKLEREIAVYDPWGKSGCGAPVRNQDGKIVADLKKYMQKKEEDTGPATNRSELPEDVSPLLRALELSEKTQNEIANEKSSQKETSNESPNTFGRGAALKELQGMDVKSPRDKVEQDTYKKFLQRQVDEKKRKADELKEKTRLEEEKENQRLAAQQERMRREYEEEQEKQKRKAEEVRQQNQKLMQLAEEKKQKEEQKKKEIKEDFSKDIQKEAELKFKAQTTEPVIETSPVRSNSPPVPAVKSKRRKHKKTPKVENNKKDTLAYLHDIRDSLDNSKNGGLENNMQEQRHLIDQLSALRRELQHQEMKVQYDLLRNKEKYSSLVSRTDWSEHTRDNRRNAFERAARVTSGRNHYERPQFHHQGINNYPPQQGNNLDSHQQEYMRQQELRLLALRQSMNRKEPTAPFSMERQASKHSLLESDSKFISMDNHQEVKRPAIESSAEPERTNITPEVENKNKPETNNEYIQKHLEEPNLGESSSISTLEVEDIAKRNDEKLKKLKRENTILSETREAADGD